MYRIIKDERQGLKIWILWDKCQEDLYGGCEALLIYQDELRGYNYKTIGDIYVFNIMNLPKGKRKKGNLTNIGYFPKDLPLLKQYITLETLSVLFNTEAFTNCLDKMRNT